MKYFDIELYRPLLIMFLTGVVLSLPMNLSGPLVSHGFHLDRNIDTIKSLDAPPLYNFPYPFSLDKFYEQF